MRAIFVILLIHGRITIIQNKFANNFCDNLLYQLQNWPNIFEHVTNLYHHYDLYLFNKLLQKSKKTFEYCRLLLPTHIE